MKIVASADALGSALALAASLNDAKIKQQITSLAAIQLVAADDAVKITANILDFQLTLAVPATVAVPGMLALPGGRITPLIGGFPGAAEIEVADDGGTARVGCGRSRFRLPVIPQDSLPAPLAITKESGRIALAHEEAEKIFSRPLFAVSTERSRYYMGGILLHDTADSLTAASTDGYRLCRVTIPGAAGLSSDHKLIVPRPAIKIVNRLLAGKDNERITLRCSTAKTLLAVEATSFTFISKLVDAVFPDYARVIPVPSGNTVTVDRIELMRALDRVAAVVDPDVKAVPLVGLTWGGTEPALHLCLAHSPGAADDIIEAEVTGHGKTAIAIGQLRELLAEHEGERVRIDTRGPSEPVLVSDPGDAGVLTLQMPSVWPFEHSQAA